MARDRFTVDDPTPEEIAKLKEDAAYTGGNRGSFARRRKTAIRRLAELEARDGRKSGRLQTLSGRTRVVAAILAAIASLVTIAAAVRAW